MNEVRDPHKAVDFMIKMAGEYASAKGKQVYLEEFRKTKKAMLMIKSDGKTVADREAFAYCHPEYVEVIEGIGAATEAAELLRYQLKAAELRVEIWRSQEASNRTQDRSMR
jgi:hypothetical protein